MSSGSHETVPVAEAQSVRALSSDGLGRSVAPSQKTKSAEEAIASLVNANLSVNGDVLAVRMVVQRMLGYMALGSGLPVEDVMRAEHAQASAELMAATVSSDPPRHEDTIRAHAQAALDEIYSVASTTRQGLKT